MKDDFKQQKEEIKQQNHYRALEYSMCPCTKGDKGDKGEKGDKGIHYKNI